MALDNFRPEFDNAYQEVFQKAIVALDSVGNTRFEKKLKFGQSVERVSFDISGVQVRSTVRGSASTIDEVNDSSEPLIINLEKEAAFHIPDGVATQAGPLNPGEEIGKQIGIKVALDLDGRIFAQVPNATYAFDNGDLTTGTSTGTGITLSSTTVPQMVSRMPAKLRNKNNQNLLNTNMVFVTDSYAASDITQYIMGKNIDLAGSTFSNGYSGDVMNARMYISEALAARATLGLATNPTANDTVTINGVTFTFVGSIGSTAGNVLIGGSADATRANLAALINTPGTTTANGVALSTANQAIISQIAATNDDTANTLTIVGTGTGRLTVAEALTAGGDTWSSNILHCYYGKKGAIDVVVQDMSPVDMRKCADRRGTNVFSSYLAGIKTFSDGAKKFLNVLVAVA